MGSVWMLIIPVSITTVLDLKEYECMAL
jgi:hypothetical protein